MLARACTHAHTHTRTHTHAHLEGGDKHRLLSRPVFVHAWPGVASHQAYVAAGVLLHDLCGHMWTVGGGACLSSCRKLLLRVRAKGVHRSALKPSTHQQVRARGGDGSISSICLVGRLLAQLAAPATPRHGRASATLRRVERDSNRIACRRQHPHHPGRDEAQLEACQHCGHAWRSTASAVTRTIHDTVQITRMIDETVQ